MNLGPKGIVGTLKETLKCRECGYPHLRRNFPRLKETKNIFQNLQEDSTAEEVGNNFHQINASLEDQWEDHQPAIVDI